MLKKVLILIYTLLVFSFLFGAAGTFFPAASADDCRTYDDGAGDDGIEIGTVDCNFGNSGGYDRSAGVRFINVTVPKDATITEAYVRFTARIDLAGAVCSMHVHGEDNATPAIFTLIDGFNDFEGRVRTTAEIDWDAIPGWTDGNTYDTPSIISIISEITSLAGWSSGNNLIIFIDHDDKPDAEAKRDFSAIDNLGGAEKTELHVTYSEEEENAIFFGINFLIVGLVFLRMLPRRKVK